MKTLYLECNMGAAGDMLMAALTELMPDKDAFVKELNDLQIPQVNIERTTIAKCGIMGTHMVVTVNGEEEKSIDVPMHAHTHSHVLKNTNILMSTIMNIAMRNISTRIIMSIRTKNIAIIITSMVMMHVATIIRMNTMRSIILTAMFMKNTNIHMNTVMKDIHMHMDTAITIPA